ncbi:hypothetical protein ABIE61_002583 [Marinobacterium sp. MBR-111]|jgi:hypothetical protein|uniref:twin-arginine translocation signal domain-containing protein n=1 Tax=Marinobacterium sp. MBR-111 TaxID=3156463 RepID=UPI00339908FF
MNTMMINRRKFLQTASMVAAAVSLLPAVSSMAGILTEEAKLNDLERDVFAKLLRISLPTEGSSLVDPATLPVLPTLENALLAGMAPHIRQGLRGGIGYFNDGAVKAFGKTFVQLDDDKAARFCDQWADSDSAPQRALAMGLKKLTTLSYWAIPDTWQPLGYDGPVSDKWNLPSLGNTPEPKA